MKCLDLYDTHEIYKFFIATVKGGLYPQIVSKIMCNHQCTPMYFCEMKIKAYSISANI